MKHCPRCKVILPLADFSVSITKRLGVECYCKVCKRAQTAEVNAARKIHDPNAAARFWPKIAKGPGPEDCWLWTASLRPDGYADFWFMGRTELVHRVSWALDGRELPVLPLQLDHTCRKRNCVNPAHLRVVTPRINSVENNDSPFAVNARRTHCSKCGNPLSGENIVRLAVPTSVGTPTVTRKCLTCCPGAVNDPRRVFEAA